MLVDTKQSVGVVRTSGMLITGINIDNGRQLCNEYSQMVL